MSGLQNRCTNQFNGRPAYDILLNEKHDDPRLSHPNDPEADLTTARNGIRYLERVRW